MSCLNPYPLYNKNGRLVAFSACGECALCRLKRSQELCFYSTCEAIDSYKRNLSCYFFTLTYTEPNMPISELSSLPTVVFSDYQKFKKRFNKLCDKHLKGFKYKTLGTTEYGGKTNRPHIHFILYGVPSSQVMIDFVYDAWNKRGNIDFGALQAGGSFYLTEYCSSAPTREAAKILYDDKAIERPHLSHSFHLGGQYLDGVIKKALKNNLCVDVNGIPQPLPSYLRRKLDPLGVKFNKYTFLEQKRIKLKNLGMTDKEYTGMLYRNYVNRCHKQGIPILDDSHSGIFLPVKKFSNTASQNAKKRYDILECQYYAKHIIDNFDFSKSSQELAKKFIASYPVYTGEKIPNF